MSNNWIPDSQLRNYILKKDLPGLPEKTIFKPCKMANQNGKPSYYFSSLTDEQVLSGEFQSYKIDPSFVENNSEWFELQNTNS